MCGIVGIFDTRGERPIDRDILQGMNDSQRHRGPDGDGLHLEPGVGLGHRRLAIIDVATGQQPLYNEDGSVGIVYNGEIYNFQELTRELIAAGHRFRTHSDTEVIVHAWEEWGADCVRRFSGMFAFALWDRNRRTLFLARDRLGKKPLYYSLLDDGLLVFGSELKSLLVHRNLRRRIDPLAVEDYFAFGYVPDPRTIVADVHKLPPATTLEVVRGRPLPGPREYWQLEFRPRSNGSEAQYASELVSQLRDAVGKRLISEVPLGAFLSGGVDSSAVVSQMAQLSDKPVTTCSISFGDPRYDESQFASLVAERYRTDHSVRRVESDDFALIDKLIDVYDEPFADSSALPTYRVCQLARERVTVALSGDAGDENLGGYRRYKWHVYEERVRRRLPLGLRRGVFGVAARLYPKLDWAPRVFRAKSTLEALARDSMEGYFHSVSVVGDALRARLFSEGFRRQLQGYNAIEVFRAQARGAPRNDPLALVQYLDFRTYLPGDILTKVDRASMAHSLEVRVPMLDHAFVEWAATVPSDLKLRGAEGKYLLKKAMEPYVPHEVMYRPKMGFAVPLAAWFRGPLRERMRQAILGGSLEAGGIFDTRSLRDLVEQHQAGRRDHSAVLWALLMFDGFQRRALAGYQG
jgi:asparagine synthase (glutamine-hydrolysing)